MDGKFVELYEITKTPRLQITYHQANKGLMLFDVVDQRSVSITIHATSSSDRMCTAVHD